MPVRVIDPPIPLITPADVPGDHSGTDPAITAMIASATATIDGPTGWIGRCFGPQTLELSAECWSDICKLPYGPVIEVESIFYVAADGSEVEVADADWTLDGDYLYFTAGWCPALANRAYPIKIQYQAGYNGEDVTSGGTGDVPEQVLAAIIEGVQQLMLARSGDIGIRSIETNDVETITYLDSDKVSAIMRRASSSLLSGLWVPTI